MAEGRVLIGFPAIFVGKYSASGTTVSYSDGRALGRSVSVSISANATSGNDFYAGDRMAEREADVFANGTLTVTVDGMLPDTERFVYGLPAQETGGGLCFDNRANPPYLGVAIVVAYMSAGVKSWDVVMLSKCRFQFGEFSANTKGETIEWQTEQHTADINRADDQYSKWREIFSGLASEAAAIEKAKTLVGVTPPPEEGDSQ